MTAALATRVVDDGAELEALVDVWAALWSRSPGATPFSHPAWLLPWLRAFRPGALFTPSVWQEGRLAALAPSFTEDGPHGRRLLPLGIGISDFCDVLIAPDASGAAEALAGTVAEARERFDVWSLEELADDAAAWSLPSPHGAVETVADKDVCPVLQLVPGAVELRALLPSGKRRKLQLARNRAARRGVVSVESADTVEGAAELFEALVTLHAARWESRGQAGVLVDPAVLRFHRDAIPGLVRADLVRLLAIRIGEVRAAVYYGLRDRGAWYGYLSGLDPAFAYESPGTLLFAAAIEAALRDGARRVHLLRGDEAYKYTWGATDTVNRRRTFSWSAP